MMKQEIYSTKLGRMLLGDSIEISEDGDGLNPDFDQTTLPEELQMSEVQRPDSSEFENHPDSVPSESQNFETEDQV